MENQFHEISVMENGSVLLNYQITEIPTYIILKGGTKHAIKSLKAASACICAHLFDFMSINMFQYSNNSVSYNDCKGFVIYVLSVFPYKVKDTGHLKKKRL